MATPEETSLSSGKASTPLTSSQNDCAPVGLLEQLFQLCTALRPRQWTKNLIVFAPLLFAIKIHESALVILAGRCFIAFCLVSGAVYIFNDVLDLEADRKHPVKCQRPIASGRISPQTALVSGVFVCLLGLVVAATVRPTLCLVLVAYLLVQASYSLALKHQPLVDVGCIASGFVLRAVAGAVAVHVPVSPWFLLCTGLASLFLALEKRRQEILQFGEAELCRKALGTYSLGLLDRLENLIVPGLLLSYMLYTFLSYHGPWMMLTIPFVLYGTARYIMLSQSGELAAAPEEVLLKDRPIQVTLVLWVLTSALAVYGVFPTLLSSISQYVDSLGLR